jgi:hypothetical protein
MEYYSNSRAAMEAESYGKITLEVGSATYRKSNSPVAPAQCRAKDMGVSDGCRGGPAYEGGVGQSLGAERCGNDPSGLSPRAEGLRTYRLALGSSRLRHRDARGAQSEEGHAG